MWRPEPTSILSMPRGSQVLNVAGGVYEAEVYGCTYQVPPYDNPHTLALAVVEGLEEVKWEISRKLRVAGRVADRDDWRVEIQIRAQGITWPAIPGITTAENPMPDDAS